MIKICFLFFTICTFIGFDYLPLIKSFRNFNNYNFREIISSEKYNNLNLSKKIYDEFLFINSQNKLIEEKIKHIKPRNPDISIIITIYNQAHCLHTCIRSIQNQNITNIEIIIIDDCSMDNSSEIIKEFQNEDPRIIFIEHDGNEGTIKSRSDGIRKARGKYITIIDGDDAFIHKNILRNSLYIAQKGSLDIVEFQAGVYEEGKLTKILKNYPSINLENIIYQPELRTKFICINETFPDDFINRAIWGKLIRATIFKKMLKRIGVEYTDDYINFAEDTIMVVSLFHLANSYYLMKEIGYLYSLDQKKIESPKLKNKICKSVDKIKDFDFFKFLKFLVDKTEKNEKEQIMVYKEIISINIDQIYNKTKLGKKHYQIIFHIFDKALKFEFLQKDQKDYLFHLKNEIIQKKNKKIFLNF